MGLRSPMLMVTGALFLFLGVGNWAMGSVKMKQYRERVRAVVQKAGPEVKRPYRGTASILERRSDFGLAYENARLKYYQYRVVHRGGRVLTILGATIFIGTLVSRWNPPAR